jgi:hypothetical protein
MADERLTGYSTDAAVIDSASSTQGVHPEPFASQSAPRGPAQGDGLVLPLFMMTIFLSSLLVFSVQPMFAKMVLPLLGGAPGVWNTAMLFFQTVLLGGYLYAHLTTRLLGMKGQAFLHLTVMAAVFVFLPISVAVGWTPPVEHAPVPWLIGLFAVSVGLPFFAVATNAPLLQRWFSHTNHSTAADPYFLYGASNLASILALLSYPILIEPLLSSHEQSTVWSWGYAILIGLIAVCAITLWGRVIPDTTPLPSSSQPATGPNPTWSRRMHWLVLAFVPSSLLLGVTMHITTDVAAVPLLWVLPLTLYLLTFVFVFARRPWLRHEWMVLAQPFFLIPIGVQRFGGVVLNVALPLAVFFVTTMVCHGELVKRRPGASHLTEFYLWMSLGGMLGGVFNVLLAPALFDSVLEYPLMLVFACFLRPCLEKSTAFFKHGDIIFPVLLLTLLGLPVYLGAHPVDFGMAGVLIFCLILGLGTFSFRLRPLRFGLGIASIFILTFALGNQDQILTRDRSFFGVNMVQRTKAGDFNLLVHGTTVHGAQFTDPTQWRIPLTYYHHDGPLGQLFSALEGETIYRNIAAIGLGTGTLACYRLPHQHWTYYEIDPSVVRLAKDTRYFHYLSECGGNTDIVMGDGRLSLATAPDGHYDMLIIDAFSSDAIPMHMITREALALYVQKLSAHGILVFHISNANLELSGVMANLVSDAHLVGRLQQNRSVKEDEYANYHWASDWVVISRTAASLAKLDADSRWKPLNPDPSLRVWTDDYSNILSVLKISSDWEK